MNESRKRTMAVIGSVLALGGIGSGLALGATAGTPSTTPVNVAPVKDIATPGDRMDAVRDVATPGDRTDLRADRETADRVGQEGVENPAAEAAGAREVGEGTAADRGHQDPPGQVDRVNDGVN